MGLRPVRYILERNDCKMDQVGVNDLVRLYSPQIGRGLDDGLVYYKSSYRRQRGAGLGGILGTIARKLIPIAKNILWPAAKKYVLPHATQAAKHMAGDVLSGRNIKESVKERGINALKGIGEGIFTQSGSGRKRRIKSKKRKAPVKKKHHKKFKVTNLF